MLPGAINRRFLAAIISLDRRRSRCQADYFPEDRNYRVIPHRLAGPLIDRKGKRSGLTLAEIRRIAIPHVLPSRSMTHPNIRGMFDAREPRREIVTSNRRVFRV